MIYNKKIAVVHDHLDWMGGGEKTALIVSLGLKCDFITSHIDSSTFEKIIEKIGPKLKILSKNKFSSRGLRFFWSRFVFWKNRKVFKKYDIVIASGQIATEAVARYCRKDAKKILYCHTPPRRVFDLHDESRSLYPWYLRYFFDLLVLVWKKRFLCSLKKYNTIVANSNTIGQRLFKYTGVKANAIIRPPIDVDGFKWTGQSDYFLSWARLDEQKRVDLIVKAFQKMSDKKLVIASGGPLFDKIKMLADGFENIEVVGWVDEDKLHSLVGTCMAAIYIPHNEDAGMTHLEANAAGKPVLVVREGGLVDSVVDGETGMFIPPSPSVEDIVKVASKMTPDWCRSKKEICEEFASNFSVVRFNNEIIKIINDES